MNKLWVAGQNGELSGETFILFNKQEFQLGVSIFGHIKQEAASNSTLQAI